MLSLSYFLDETNPFLFILSLQPMNMFKSSPSYTYIHVHTHITKIFFTSYVLFSKYLFTKLFIEIAIFKALRKQSELQFLSSTYF